MKLSALTSLSGLVLPLAFFGGGGAVLSGGAAWGKGLVGASALLRNVYC